MLKISCVQHRASLSVFQSGADDAEPLVDGDGAGSLVLSLVGGVHGQHLELAASGSDQQLFGEGLDLGLAPWRKACLDFCSLTHLCDCVLEVVHCAVFGLELELAAPCYLPDHDEDPQHGAGSLGSPGLASYSLPASWTSQPVSSSSAEPAEQMVAELHFGTAER